MPYIQGDSSHNCDGHSGDYSRKCDGYSEDEAIYVMAVVGIIGTAVMGVNVPL